MLLALQNLTKTFPGTDGAQPVLRDVSLTLGRGESLALTGESGSGKSTLLHIAGGLDRADGGRVVFDGQDLGGMAEPARAALRRRRIGLVFQQFNLIPSLSVRHNLSFQARLAGIDDPAGTQAMADRLGLAGQLDKYPEHLSGGQQQRVAIGRAVLARPDLILADEPTGNLDEATSDTVLDLFLSLVAERDTAVLMVTHSARLAGRLDRHLHLSRGQVQ